MVKVKELVQLLSKHGPDMAVVISDGYGCNFYRGDYTISEYQGCVDISVSDWYMEEE